MIQTATEGKLVLALTGHRPDKLAGYNMQNEFYDRLRERLVRIIERSLENYPIVECHSGMALGADTIWAEAIIECRERYGDARVIFVADIPDYSEASPSKLRLDGASIVRFSGFSVFLMTDFLLSS